jgi:hypothetical protein
VFPSIERDRSSGWLILINPPHQGSTQSYLTLLLPDILSFCPTTLSWEASTNLPYLLRFGTKLELATGVFPLREVSHGEDILAKVYPPVCMSHLGRCKRKFGRLLENPNKFWDELIKLRLSFSLTWQKVIVVFAHFYTADE